MDSGRIHRMKVSDVYPLYVQKAERKGRTREEVNAVIRWLTGYDDEGLFSQLEKGADFASFFAQAPQINPNADKVKGVICGVRVEDLEDPVVRLVRVLDKLVDELAKGRPLEKVLRS